MVDPRRHTKGHQESCFLRGIIPAVLSLALNLPLAIVGAHRAAYDTYVHIFFADHYRLNWFELRDYRWYTGFSVNSYPPLVHQVIALLSRPLSVLASWFAPRTELPGLYRYRGEEIAYVVVLLAVLAAFPYAAQGFARIFVGPRAARWAGRLAILGPAIGLAGWSFGQLPTLVSTLLFLLALAHGYRWLSEGNRPALLRSVAFVGATAGAHHAALLFAVFGGGAVVAQALIGQPEFNAKAQPPEGGRRGKGAKGLWLSLRPLRLGVFALRILLWAALSSLVVAFVLWPFFEWSAGYRPQTPIDHASRHNFIVDPAATFTFFWPIYGAFLLFIPWTILAAVRLPRLRAPAALFALFFTLGLGGTTPLPRLLFGSNWEWLTYDRFALWATICLLPFAGAAMLVWRREPRLPEGGKRREERESLGYELHKLARIGRAHFVKFVPFVAKSGLRNLGLWILLVASFLYASLLSLLKPAQPPPLDLAPMAEFLAEGANDQWRYLTLGFGDQAARLAVLTTAATPDGSYHTAREIPELRRSGIGQLDTLLWQPAGVEAARAFLRRAADDWAVRWIFVNHTAYHPALRATGWKYDRTFVNGVELWRKDRVWPVAPWRLTPSGPTFAARWWGIAPLAALALATALGALTDAQLGPCLTGAARWAFYALFVLFPFGWNETIRLAAPEAVKTPYRSIVIFIADGVLIGLLATWLIGRWAAGGNARRLSAGDPRLGWAALGLMAAVASSAIGSAAPGISIAMLLHLGLLGGLYVFSQTEKPNLHLAAVLLTAQLLIQSGLALRQFGAQSTDVWKPLNLPYVGAFTPDEPGASVVQTPDRTRWLRAYGSLWHPNVLGAVLVMSLAGTLIEGTRGTGGTKGTISLSTLLSFASFSVGLAALALTFSRAAWLGLIVMALVLIVRLPASARRRLWPLLPLSALALGSVVLPFHSLFLTRATADRRSPLERFSMDERTSLAEAALRLARENLWTGVGAGGFVKALAESGLPVSLEPAHNVPLLILAEIGLVGAAALVGLALALGIGLARRPRSPQDAVLSATLIALMVMSLFDHFLWTTSPGRLMFTLAVCLWTSAYTESEI